VINKVKVNQYTEWFYKFKPWHYDNNRECIWSKIMSIYTRNLIQYSI